MNRVRVIGAGLAGCEAAYQLAMRGISVELVEMKPKKKTEAHTSGMFGELVCSNSLRSNDLANAVGLLKEEMRRLNSLIMQAADQTRVAAGGALAVNRHEFSAFITEKIRSSPMIEIVENEAVDIDINVPTIIATGPLTSERMSEAIARLLKQEYLYFFDAAAPIVTHESIDFESAFIADRYGKGDSDYVNCPMNKEEYDAFYNAIITAETAELHGFENSNVFEGCMPIEVMAARGYDTMRFGPLKPVGLTDPKTGARPYAVVQLRRENAAGEMYNIVGFQTHLKFPEQKRVFSMIPALKNAEYVRYGVMHRNTFINAPKVINKYYQLLGYENVFMAGQITGVEGYVESASSGLLAGINMSRKLQGREMLDLTIETAIGALPNYISGASDKNFQPMNVNYGIMAELGVKIRDKKQQRMMISERSLKYIDSIKEDI